MATRQDLVAGLLTGLGQQAPDPMRAMSSADRKFAMQAQALKGLRGNVGSLFGVDTMTPGEGAQKALAQLDPTKKEDRTRILEIVSRVNPERVPMLREEFSRRDAAEQSIEIQGTQREKFATYLDNTYSGKGYGDLALQGVITPANMKDFIEDVEESADFNKGVTYTVEDGEGNAYTMIPSFDKTTGKIQNTYSPITPDAPAVPVGKVEITGGEFAQTAGESRDFQLKSKSEQKQEVDYQEQRVAMVSQMPELNAKYANLQRAEDLLDTVATGGPVNLIGTGLETFFGKKPKDKAELEIIFGLEMLKSLKPFFGGVISDSESARLEKIYAGLEKGSEANKGILATLKKELDNAMKKAELYRNAKTFKDFETTMGVMFPAGETQVDSPDVIDFNDLD